MARREFKSATELSAWLEAAGIAIENWGRDGAKRVTDLWGEYTGGESTFQDDPPARLVEVVQVIFRRGDTVLLELAQEFADGRQRVRMRPPSEKLKADENPHDTALRCLREELGLMEEEVEVSEKWELSEQRAESPSYPGLETRYVFYTFAATAALPDGDFTRENQAPGDPIRRHVWGWRVMGQ